MGSSLWLHHSGHCAPPASGREDQHPRRLRVRSPLTRRRPARTLAGPVRVRVLGAASDEPPRRGGPSGRIPLWLITEVTEPECEWGSATIALIARGSLIAACCNYRSRKSPQVLQFACAELSSAIRNALIRSASENGGSRHPVGLQHQAAAAVRAAARIPARGHSSRRCQPPLPTTLWKGQEGRREAAGFHFPSGTGP